MDRTNGRIPIPQNVPDLLDLASKVYGKHQTDGESSPLSNLDGTSWAVVGPKIAPALTKHLQAEEWKNKMEEAYRERDLFIPSIKEAVTTSRNLLKALNAKNPKRLSEWGYQVNDSVQSTKTPKAPQA